MDRRAWIIVGTIVVIFGGLLWATWGARISSTPKEPAPPPQTPAPQSTEAAEPSKSAAPAKPAKGKHSLAVSGRGHHSLHNFTMHDKQGREVVRLKKISGVTDVNALQRGTFHVTNAKIENVELTLYRDKAGKLSLVGALKQQPPSVRHSLNVPPTDKHEKGPWLMDVGPIEVKDATLTIGFTKKPVIFHVDSAKITVQRRAEDPGPVIYLHEVQGHMLKPKPLPKPVRIAWANGLVNLVGKPLVHLAARTCIRKSELRIDAIVEARKEPVHLEGDSHGILGALGRLGINIAAHVKKKKMTYKHEAVHIDGGPGCKDAEVPLEQPKKPKPKQKK